MPSTSKKQHNFMAAVAHSPEFAKKAGVPTSVGKDFLNADKGRKFKEGGEMKESKAMVKKEIGFMKKAGAPKSMVKHEMGEMGMKKGGNTARMNRLEELGRVNAEKASTAKGKSNLTAEKKRIVGELKYAGGGMTKMGAVRTAAPSRDGIASKGKTQGKMVKMKYGGKAC
jgi:hypothetical protein